ncbi:MAG: hypothetical protein DMG98_16710, partial [Acidobacteria bacterium]
WLSGEIFVAGSWVRAQFGWIVVDVRQHRGTLVNHDSSASSGKPSWLSAKRELEAKERLERTIRPVSLVLRR